MFIVVIRCGRADISSLARTTIFCYRLDSFSEYLRFIQFTCFYLNGQRIFENCNLHFGCDSFWNCLPPTRPLILPLSLDPLQRLTHWTGSQQKSQLYSHIPGHWKAQVGCKKTKQNNKRLGWKLLVYGQHGKIQGHVKCHNIPCKIFAATTTTHIGLVGVGVFFSFLRSPLALVFLV